jgi:hypothetical protein
MELMSKLVRLSFHNLNAFEGGHPVKRDLTKANCPRNSPLNRSLTSNSTHLRSDNTLLGDTSISSQGNGEALVQVALVNQAEQLPTSSVGSSN